MRIAHRVSTTGPNLTISIGGIAYVPHASDSLLEAMVRADKALYEAKHQGKNRVLVHDQP